MALSFPATATIVSAQTESHCLNVSAEQSIAAEVQNAHVQGISKPKFTLHAKVTGTEDFKVNVRKAVPAVTSKTTTSFGNGVSCHVKGRDATTIMVRDQQDALVIITIKENGIKVNGIVQKDGAKVKCSYRAVRAKRWV
jgi:hypothetical protein